MNESYVIGNIPHGVVTTTKQAPLFYIDNPVIDVVIELTFVVPAADQRGQVRASEAFCMAGLSKEMWLDFLQQGSCEGPCRV